ncbi:alpha-ribazole transporter [Desulfocicer vacuolatum DSM 3385]|uniref:Alpha-ribazole transporter n=1 Tax=Desulfocicer vacuolatum DSM 3385 TaxID=1121400 RepID=A0A1W2EN08_9BACT|nr:alpha-ribazole transporter [Desulfocicer vacuolatum]SMD10666.1 alpha-ribazole transporter [Desulfocicer vacuolatum DSM 3385]
MSNIPDQKGDLNTRTLSVKRMAYMAVFIALSAVGAMVKIPSPVGTIGLDSAPGYFCGLALGYVEGICVIFMGHLITSGIMGFPLGIPIHFFIALQLALWVTVFVWVSRRFGAVPGAIVAVVLNGGVSAFTMALVGGMGAVLGTMPFLIAGSLVNVAIAVISHRVVHAGKLV